MSKEIKVETKLSKEAADKLRAQITKKGLLVVKKREEEGNFTILGKVIRVLPLGNKTVFNVELNDGVGLDGVKFKLVNWFDTWHLLAI